MLVLLLCFVICLLCWLRRVVCLSVGGVYVVIVLVCCDVAFVVCVCANLSCLHCVVLCWFALFGVWCCCG